MEATLNKNTQRCFKNVYSATFSREETAETVVPDVLPDISAILYADGMVLLRSKEVQEGRVSVSATIPVTVIYEPEGEAGVRCLTLTIPFEASVEAPGIPLDCRPVAVLELASLDARLLNPRKVLVRADVAVRLDCFMESELTLCDAVSGGGAAGAQTKTENLEASFVTGVREKTFVISDEYPMPASKPPMGELLRQNVSLNVDDVKAVGNKLVFKGDATVVLLYSAAGTNEPTALEYTTSYSQIMEMEGLGGEPEALMSVMVTGVYFDPMANAQGGKTVVMELHLVAQCVCMETRELSCLTDAYSNKYTLELTGENLDCERIRRRMSLRETLRETMSTQDPVREVVCACASAGRPAVDAEGVSVPVRVTVLYKNDAGRVCSATGRYAVRANVERDEGDSLRVLACRAAEVYASPAGGGLELRVPVDIELLLVAPCGIYMITGIGYDEEKVTDNSKLPSIILMRAGDGLWELAKGHASTVALIRQANGLEDGELPEAGRILLIPRAR